MDFAILADNRVKLKDIEKKISTKNPARELTKLWNMKVTVIPTVIDALRIVTEGLYREWGLGNKRTSGEHSINRLDEIGQMPKRILVTWGDLLSVRLQKKKPSANADVKNSQMSIIIAIITDCQRWRSCID